jgi:hypothetical protein
MKIIKNRKTKKVKIKFGNLRISGKGPEIEALVEFLLRTCISAKSEEGIIRRHKDGTFAVHRKNIETYKMKHPMEEIE